MLNFIHKGAEIVPRQPILVQHRSMTSASQSRPVSELNESKVQEFIKNAQNHLHVNPTPREVYF